MPNVGEARDEQRALRALDHLLDARSRRRRLEDERKRALGCLFFCCARVREYRQRLDHAVANGYIACAGTPSSAAGELRQLRSPRVAHDVDARIEEPRADPRRSARQENTLRPSSALRASNDMPAVEKVGHRLRFENDRIGARRKHAGAA